MNSNLTMLCIGFSVIQVQAADDVSRLVYIGTRSAEGDPQVRKERGIYAARFDGKTGKLTPLGIQAILDGTNWLATHPDLPVIYSIASAKGGKNAMAEIFSYEIDQRSGKLYLINKVRTGGIYAVHQYIDSFLKTIFVANMGSGDVTALPLQHDGGLGPVASGIENYGSGPTKRQNKPKPHGINIDSSHRYVLCSDFGADRIFVYQLESTTRALTRANPPFLPTPPGSGPRHMVFHPNGQYLYFNTELEAEVYVCSFDPENGNLNILQTLPSYPAEWKEKKSSAEIGASRDGRFVYVTLRTGQNCIVVYSVNEQDGTLKEIQRISSQGESPWCYDIDPTGHWMLVTNRDSDLVNVFSIDPNTGRLKATKESLQIPKPISVAFYPN